MLDHKLPTRPDCGDSSGSSFKEVNLNHVYGAYVILGGGYAAAIALLFLEMVARGRRQSCYLIN